MTKRFDASHYRRLERMARTAPICRMIGARFEFDRGQAKVSFEVKPEFLHAAHALHGALYFFGLDTAAFFAANTLVPDVFVYTSSFTTYLIRPITSGSVVAEGHVVHEGRSQIFADAELIDDQGRQCARGNGLFVRSKLALNEEIGYR